MEKKGEIIIYQTPDGQTEIDVTMEKETVWLSQHQIAELFDTDRSVITKHINNIYKSEESISIKAMFLHFSLIHTYILPI